MGAINGIGKEYDITMNPGANLLTTTSQFSLVSLVGGTSTADRTVELCGNTGTYGTPTAASYFAIGVNQSYLSASSVDCSVRLFGISKVVCAASIPAGSFIKAYSGVSTTTMAGRVVAIANGASISVATASISAQMCVVGRALESGSTGTVISAFINPQIYDQNLIQ